MFNRAIQVKMVNTKKQEPQEPVASDSYFEKKAEVVSREIDGVMRKVGMLAIGYVVVDTLRQVLVARANRF
jgi:hypothetical protein